MKPHEDFVSKQDTRTLLALIQMSGEGQRGISVGALAARLGNAKSTVSVRLRRLREAGLVELTPGTNNTLRPTVGFTGLHFPKGSVE